MFGLIFNGKSTAAVLALAAHFLVSQRIMLANGENNSDCLPAALDSAMRAVGHVVDAVSLARVNPDGTIAPGVTSDVVAIDRREGDPRYGELERLRIELTGGSGLSSGVGFGPHGLVRNENGHGHGTPPSGIPHALEMERLVGHALPASAPAVIAALSSGKRAIVMGGTVGTGDSASCHATTAVGIDPNTHAVVVLDPEASSKELSQRELADYFNPSASDRTIFGCPAFAYEIGA